MTSAPTLAAYVAALEAALAAALPPAADYLEVFRITGTATFMAYALGAISESIWFARPWKSLAMNTCDALLYAGVAGGVFGWLWPI